MFPPRAPFFEAHARPAGGSTRRSLAPPNRIVGRPQPTCAAAVHPRRTSSPTVASHHGREAAGLATASDTRGCGPPVTDLEPNRRKSWPRSGRLATVQCGGDRLRIVDTAAPETSAHGLQPPPDTPFPRP